MAFKKDDKVKLKGTDDIYVVSFVSTRWVDISKSGSRSNEATLSVELAETLLEKVEQFPDFWPLKPGDILEVEAGVNTFRLLIHGSPGNAPRGATTTIGQAWSMENILDNWRDGQDIKKIA